MVRKMTQTDGFYAGITVYFAIAASMIAAKKMPKMRLVYTPEMPYILFKEATEKEPLCIFICVAL